MALKLGSSLVGPVGKWLKSKGLPRVSPGELIKAADLLAYQVRLSEDRLRDQLRAGVGVTIPLELRGLDGSAIGFETLAARFEGLDQPRRLVILGDAGAGKTCAVNQLVLDLLERRAETPESARALTPVPVRVSPSGWDGRQHFSKWLAGQLALEYQVPWRFAYATVRNGHVLPVLDGMDDMDPVGEEPDRAREALQRLCTKAPWSARSAVVACRKNVYDHVVESHGPALPGAEILVVQGLIAEDIWSYLDRYRDRYQIAPESFSPLVNEVVEHTDGPIVEVLSTPLMLGMAAAMLHRDGEHAAIALAKTTETKEAQRLLLGSLIPLAVAGADENDRAAPTSEATAGLWLRTLARYLEQQRHRGREGTGFTLDQVWRLAGVRTCLAVHAGLSALAAGAILGPLALLHRVNGLTLPVTALVLAPVLLVGYGLEAGSQSPLPGFRGISERFAWRVPGRSRWPRALRGGIVVGGSALVIFAAFTAFAGVFGPSESLSVYLSVYAVLAGIAGAVAGITSVILGFSTTFEERLILGQSERQTIRDGRLSALWSGLAAFLLFGVFGLATALLILGGRYDSEDATRGALSCGIWAGFVVWYLVGFAGQRHLAASLVLKVSGEFSSRPSEFLDRARRAGILRANGIAYEFRHLMFQQWLAEDWAGPES
ncbi:NACHT domain-containing protein [Nocardia sp. CDC160]|uniref:NACHT domain-containing protein n=1 Tax=Nocardia sp. CDC160 TaxID=3112166 RepID=UPI002DB5D687|nr:NACHT domain-containing protein [Nocardia sp. CDC160]MEC3918414.1 NACHT domain-containing protein [Nocardia sp. CDC160]MEC3919151.1 NACHT domain-containing protein [Nocardia sp. CDC160]